MKLQFAILAACLAGAAALAGGIFSHDPQGVLHVGDECTLRLGINYQSSRSKFNYFTQSNWYRFSPSMEKTGDRAVRFVSRLLQSDHLPDTVIDYREIDENTLEGRFEVEIPAEDFNCDGVRLELILPIAKAMGKQVSFKGQSFTFPLAASEHGFGFGIFRQCDDFVLPLTTGELRIQFTPRDVSTFDSRFFNPKYTEYALRIPMDQHGVHFSIAFRLSYVPYAVRPVEMKGVFNRTFADAKAGDRQGGWTDQGPEQDLGMIRPGVLEYPPVRFNIADDRSGNSCLVLGGKVLDWLVDEAVVPVEPASAATFFLLHAIAWAPGEGKAVGEVIANYADGTRSVFPVRDQIDVANWWGPTRSFENARLVWRGNISNLGEVRGVGLFLSAFHPDPGRQLVSVTLRANGAVWMTAAMALSPQRIQSVSVSQEEFAVRRSEAFLPYRPCLDVEAGSALDFSFMQDAPAGRHGQLKADASGGFYFERRPGQPFRIFGTNLCFGAAMMDKSGVDLLIRQLKGFGYNAVRLHHFDVMLCGWNSTSPHPDPGRLDAFFYTLSQLKKAGIYYCLDLYTARGFDLGNYPEIRTDPGRSYYTPSSDKDIYNLAAMLLPSARNELKEFSRVLLNTVNPHTGMALKDDPALISISVLNENSMLISLDTPLSIMKEQYIRAFEEYCRKNRRQVAPADFDDEFSRFALEVVYKDYYDDMTDFLRNEIGTRALLTDQNFVGYPNLVFQREWYDFVDEHHYSGGSAVSNGFSGARGLEKRLFGKPFVVSECGYPLPNPHRAEGGLVFPALAAMQNWQGLYSFCHANRQDLVESPDTGLEKFDIANDPARNIPERIAAMIFLRGDVSPLGRSIVTTVGYDNSRHPFVRHYPDYASAAIFGAKIGSMPANGDRPFPADAIAVTDISQEYSGKLPVLRSMEELRAFAKSNGLPLLGGERVDAANGEVSADFKGQLFQVTTSRTEGFFFRQAGHAAGKALAAASDSEAMIAATSLDGKALADSERVLITHVTEMENENTVYADESRSIVIKSAHQERPVQILFRVAKATIELECNLPSPRLYALDCGGRRIKEIPYMRDGGRIRFEANTNCDGIACFAYELAK